MKVYTTEIHVIIMVTSNKIGSGFSEFNGVSFLFVSS